MVYDRDAATNTARASMAVCPRSNARRVPRGKELIAYCRTIIKVPTAPKALGFGRPAVETVARSETGHSARVARGR